MNRLNIPEYIPTTKEELTTLGWNNLDIILVSGDAYMDSPFIGVSVIGKVLISAGYKVGIIAQPELDTSVDITRLGEPGLFWGVTAGSIDSMVANYTATGKKRRRDDYTPGGENNRRPDRATIVYTNLIKQYFKPAKPIVLGGIEASLRRVAHYDFWTDKIRRSVLLDAKADFLVHGMAERSIVALADALRTKSDIKAIRGICYLSKEKPEGCIELPEYKIAAADKDAFTQMFHTFYNNNDPVNAKTLVQKYDNRYLVLNPPAHHLSGEELDRISMTPYARDLHPYYRQDGPVRALDTIRFSISTHRGCYGECNFCAIAVHEGRRVRWRSKESIVKEAEELAAHPDFKGTIHDVGGPTANMYGFECTIKEKTGCCKNKHCLLPEVCNQLPVKHDSQIDLLKEIRQIKGVKKVVVASGIRYDMILNDKANGKKYLQQVVRHHVSGQMKIAPEHSEPNVLAKMGKPGKDKLLEFRKMFYEMTKEDGKKQFLTYYMIAAHPGCSDQDMKNLRTFASKELKLLPEQIQVFTPTPSTYSTLMYWTEKDPFTGEPVFVEKTVKGRIRQKDVMIRK